MAENHIQKIGWAKRLRSHPVAEVACNPALISLVSQPSLYEQQQRGRERNHSDRRACVSREKNCYEVTDKAGNWFFFLVFLNRHVYIEMMETEFDGVFLRV